MAIFESKIKKSLRLSKYLFFVFVGAMLSFIPFQKGDSKAIFSGLSIDPSIAHAEMPATSPVGGGSVGSVGSGSDTPGSGPGAGGAADASDAGDTGDGCAW